MWNIACSWYLPYNISCDSDMTCEACDTDGIYTSYYSNQQDPNCEGSGLYKDKKIKKNKK